MRRAITTGLMLLACASLAWASEAGVKKMEVKRPDLAIPSFVGWVPDEIVVQFDKSAVMNFDQTTMALGKSGLNAIDQLNRQYQAVALTRQFAASQPRVYNGRTIDLSGWHKIKFASAVADIEAVVAEYQRLPGVIDAQPIGIHTVYATPNDPQFASQYHLNQANDHDVDAPEAWDQQTGNSQIIVAMLDTGVRYYHKDLGGANAAAGNFSSISGNMWKNPGEIIGNGIDDDGNGYIDDIVGYDFVSAPIAGSNSCWPGEDCTTKDNDPRDFNGHGTHCAGNIAAINNNGYATASVSGGWLNGAQQVAGNGVKVMACRIGSSEKYFGFLNIEVGYVRMDYCAEAFNYAANNGAHIASCSWGSSNSGGLAAAIDNFLAAGGLIFKAAGNDNTGDSPDYMGSRTDIINVAATDQNDLKSDFSNYGSYVDVAAPGTDILSLYHNHSDAANDYVATVSGTSMATPIAASVAALIWSADPSQTAAQVRSRLQSTADNLDGLNPSYAGKLGAGRVNAFRAIDGLGAPPTPPTAPTNLTANAVSSSQINLVWQDNATNETGFEIDRATTSGGPYTQIATTGANVINYSNTGLSPNTTYYYRVRATNGAGDSGNSNEAFATTQSPPPPPAAPTNLAANAVSSSQINLAWQDNASDETGFEIDRATTSGGPYTQIATTGANVTTYSNTGLSPNTTYYYRVRATNGAGDSGNSNEAFATTQSPPPPPAAPTNLTANAVSSSQINLAWQDNSSDETGFEIDRATTSGGPYTQIATTGANVTTYSNTGLSPNTTYYYRVRATNGSGDSNNSNEAFATTQNAPSGNLALNKNATASSTYNSTYTPARAVDGSTASSSYWRSGSISSSNPGAWLRVDLGAQYSLTRGVVKWRENYYATQYRFQISNTGGSSDAEWTTVYTNNSGAAGTQDVSFTSPFAARYFRIRMDKNRKSNYRVFELECYAGSSPAPKPAGDEPGLIAAEMPADFELGQNYPNPFNPSTNITFSVPQEEHVTLKVFNVIGEEVATLVNGRREAGVYTVSFAPADLPSGIYFYVLQASETRLVRRLVFMK
ncbi:S8 family serine peptidase [bacterium]|nr:S8 family serine peptidase [bacterium]